MTLHLYKDNSGEWIAEKLFVIGINVSLIHIHDDPTKPAGGFREKL